MKTVAWNGSAWWVDPALWVDGDAGAVTRPTEDEVICRVRRQAQVWRRPLLRLLVSVDRWYHDTHPEVAQLVRLQLIARRFDMTLQQVDAALDEADRLIEVGAL